MMMRENGTKQNALVAAKSWVRRRLGSKPASPERPYGRYLSPMPSPGQGGRDGKKTLPPKLELMIDAETLGLRAGSVMWEVGLVCFDRCTGEISTRLKVSIDIYDALRCGLTVDDETANYWEEIGGVRQPGDRMKLAEGMTFLGGAIADLMTGEGAARKIWCCGGSFDFPILQAGFEAVGLEKPWNHFEERDVRTWCEEIGVRREKGATHDALEDCERQIRDLKAADEALTAPVMLTREKSNNHQRA